MHLYHGELLFSHMNAVPLKNVTDNAKMLAYEMLVYSTIYTTILW